MKKIENQLDKSKKNQTLAEIAKQGFTVRNGHNPNKLNSFENPVSGKTDTIFSNDLNFEEEELDDEGNIMVENDEFDNPSDYFENTDDVVY